MLLKDDKIDEKCHCRAPVKMGVCVIYRADVFNHGIHGPENFAALFNNPVSSPPVTLACTQTTAIATSSSNTSTSATTSTHHSHHSNSAEVIAASHQLHHDMLTASAPSTMPVAPSSSSSVNETRSTYAGGKSRKSERVDSFPT
ncbi:uncharacterized protein isoform X1 [Musca autumnalis]|uniref:uncharacterized protein isoform X1 n=2 Tax=Musca autumnalis TaxID=221902 RepID=UPI003CEF5CFB